MLREAHTTFILTMNRYVGYGWTPPLGVDTCIVGHAMSLGSQ